MTNSQPSSYSVTLLEAFGITLGAIALVLAGSVRLAQKYIGNMSDPNRAETIARSLIDYEIPGGSRGFFGINIGGEKTAIINSINNLQNTDTPELEIIAAKVPNTRTENIANFLLSSSFESESASAVKQNFCGRSTSMLIETGQKTLSDEKTKVRAVKYTLKALVGNHERQVIITAVGQNAEKNAKVVLESLRCVIVRS